MKKGIEEELRRCVAELDMGVNLITCFPLKTSFAKIEKTFRIIIHNCKNVVFVSIITYKSKVVYTFSKILVKRYVI